LMLAVLFFALCDGSLDVGLEVARVHRSEARMIDKSLAVRITPRCVCTDGTLGICVFGMPASVAPLAAMAAQLIVPPVCGDVILICLVISRFALPTSTAFLAAALRIPKLSRSVVCLWQSRGSLQ
jgi:hypothetical protein